MILCFSYRKTVVAGNRGDRARYVRARAGGISAAAVAWIPRAALQILFLLSSDPSTGIGGSAAGCSWAVFSLAMDAICLCLLIGTTSKDSRQVSRQTFKTRDSPQNSRCKGRSPFTGRAGKWSPLAAMIIDQAFRFPSGFNLAFPCRHLIAGRRPEG